MAFIETVPPADATGAVREMYERQQKKFGYVPNYAKVFSHRPEVMSLWADLLAGIRRHLDRRRFELVTLAAAHSLRNSYCALAHASALGEFHGPAEICAVLDGSGTEALSPAERAMVAFARRVAAEPEAVSADDVTALQAHGFADDEIFDIVATVAARAFFTRLLDGLGAEPDAAYLDVEAPLRRALVVGRPIAAEPVERLETADRSTTGGA